MHRDACANAGHNHFSALKAETSAAARAHPQLACQLLKGV